MRLVAGTLLSLFIIGFAARARAAEVLIPFDGMKSSWHGFDRYDFLMDETNHAIEPYQVSPDEKNAVKAQVKGRRRCVVVVPEAAAPGNPWSWRGCYWDHEPQTEVELLKRGFHIAFAAPDADAQGKVWDTWYKFLTEKHGLAKKAAFIGMSKGGVNAYNWGVANPDKVACIYADNPALYDDDFAKVPELAKHDIPLLHICGSEDFLLRRHTRVVENIYHQLGGMITVIVKEGHAHHPHSLRNAKPIADWIEQHMTPSTAKRPAFVDATFTKGYYYSLEPSFIDLKEEGVYATARGPGFTACYDRYDSPTSGKFRMGGMSIITPKTAAPGKPWLFTGDPIERDATVEQALLAKGYHIISLAPAGSGLSRKQWDDAYKILVDHGFSNKPILKGTGAMAGEAYAWAVENPSKVSCIYARNPLMKSLMAGETQPIDNLAALAKAHVPVLHDCGALDPWLDDQTRVVEKRYQELDGKITVIVREGEGHFPLSPKDPKSVVDFIISNTPIPVKGDAATSHHSGGAASKDDYAKQQAGDGFRFTGRGRMTPTVQVGKVGDYEVALNSWIYPNVYKWQEYRAGEAAGPVASPLNGAPQKHGGEAGSRRHALVMMEPYRVREKVETPKSRLSASRSGNYISECKAKGGAVTINLGGRRDGTVDPNAGEALRDVYMQIIAANAVGQKSAPFVAEAPPQDPPRQVRASNGDAKAAESVKNIFDKNSPFYFASVISRQTLENYLDRSITMGYFLVPGKPEGYRFPYRDDDVRMIHNLGAKLIGRAVYRWGEESKLGDPAFLEYAKNMVDRVHDDDPEVVFQGCLFEHVSTDINNLKIPAWVFTDFGLPVEDRTFSHAAIIKREGRADRGGGRGGVPIINNLETRLWFYFLAVSYINVGCEALHLGQVGLIGVDDKDLSVYSEFLAKVRTYANLHARRGLVLMDGHVPSGGMIKDGISLLDFNSFPIRIKAVPGKPREGVLEVGHLDAIFKRSKGCISPSGWKCESLPYLVELDNFGRGPNPNVADPNSMFCWGWDEISWFAQQPEEYRNQWLIDAHDWLKKTDPNGRIEMPGTRMITCPNETLRTYFANTKSPTCPVGYSQEETIKKIWNQGQSSRPARISR